MHAISVSNLHKHFGDIHVLRGLDFDLRPGQATVLLGANGCGKSTLMRCINGLERADQGHIAIGSTDMASATRSELRAVRRRIGVVFQRFNLVNNLSVFQNVLFGGMGHQRGGLLRCMALTATTESRDRAMHCLERVNLAEKAGQKAEHLSGGQQQRVAIARMLMQEPEIVLADEPIASLDPKSGREVMKLLWDVVEERGMTVLCTLHQLDVAMDFGERILGMKAGRIQIDEATANLRRAELDALYQGNVRVDGVGQTTDEHGERTGRTADQAA